MPDFLLCVLPPEMLTDEQKWYLKGGDMWLLEGLGLDDQFELSALLESFVRDFCEFIEQEVSEKNVI